MGIVIDMQTRGKDGPISWAEYDRAIENRSSERDAALAYKALAGIKDDQVFVPDTMLFRSEFDDRYGSLHLITGTDDRVETHENFPRSLQEMGADRAVALKLATSSVVGLVVAHRNLFSGRTDVRQAVVNDLRRNPIPLDKPNAWRNDAFIARDEGLQSIHTVTHRVAAAVALEASGMDPLIIEEEALPVHIAALTDPMPAASLQRIVGIKNSTF